MRRPCEEIPDAFILKPHVPRSVIAGWLHGLPTSRVPFLRPHHFQDECDQALWNAARQLDAEQASVDTPTLLDRARAAAAVDGLDWHDDYLPRIAALDQPSELDFQVNAYRVYRAALRLRAYRDQMRHIMRTYFPGPPLLQREPPGRVRIGSGIEELCNGCPGLLPLGLVVLYSEIARLCRFTGGLCSVPSHWLADNIGSNPVVVARDLRQLLRLGYLEDSEPDAPTASHTYRMTGRFPTCLDVELLDDDPEHDA